MASRLLALIRPLPGLVAAGIALLFSLGTLAAVALYADGVGHLGRFDWLAVRFTVLQAAVSALLSVTLAVPVARALARRRFPGRDLLIAVMGAPFILPVIVAILGLIAVFGRNGILSGVAGLFGLPPLSIYGFHGVILAHVFFNLPLATRLLLHGWLSIRSEHFRNAASLGFGPKEMFLHIEWPMLRALLPGALVVIFLICCTSFAIALTLGGGPKATTVELAIYQAFKFDFDLSKAALLSGVQFGVCGAAALLSIVFPMPDVARGGLDRQVIRFQTGGRVADTLWIAGAAAFLVVPLGAIIMDGIMGLFTLRSSVWWAALRSLWTALGSTVVAVLLGLSLSTAALRWRGFEVIGLLSIAASPLVMGTGLFIIVYPFVDPALLALPVTALVNAVMSLPFLLRILLPAIRDAERRFGHLATSLGLVGWRRFTVVILPRIRTEVGFAAGLCAALSMGDLGVITLFSAPDTVTLPLEMYRLMGAYRMDQAMGAAVLLLGLSLGLFYLFDKGGRWRADA